MYRLCSPWRVPAPALLHACTVMITRVYLVERKQKGSFVKGWFCFLCPRSGFLYRSAWFCFFVPSFRFCWQERTIYHHHVTAILIDLTKAMVDMIFLCVFQDVLGGIYRRVGDPELDFALGRWW